MININKIITLIMIIISTIIAILFIFVNNSLMKEIEILKIQKKILQNRPDNQYVTTLLNHREAATKIIKDFEEKYGSWTENFYKETT
ncbi:MAG: hypothetical protein ACFFG0_03575 [Candidatus Thorarchaeota archaeon]